MLLVFPVQVSFAKSVTSNARSCFSRYILKDESNLFKNTQQWKMILADKQLISNIDAFVYRLLFVEHELI